MEKQIIDYIKSWLSHREIANITGIPKTTISRIRNEAGLWVPSQNRKISNISKYNYIQTYSIGEGTGKITVAWIDTSTFWEVKWGLKIWNWLEYKNWEVTTIEEELTQLEKIIEKLKAKWIDIGWINYQWKEKHISKALTPFLWGDVDNVLVIGDLHSPHIIDWYLEFCRKQQEKWNCWTVIFIGDIIDFASISYHEAQVEELNPSWEIAEARRVLQDWYKTFPKAYVCFWNHDLLPYRKAKTAWLLREYIQTPHSIFEAPVLYEFIDEIEICWVIYTHWTKWDAFTKCVKEWTNLVQWHLHSKAGVQRHNNRQWNLFWMQVATGIDYKKKAFDYARAFPSQPVVWCWVVVENGTLPIFLKM